MSGEDDRHWQKLQREKEANRRRHGDERAAVTDPTLLHPANEGHDAERARSELERWAGEELGRGPDARRLRALERGEAPPAEVASAGGAAPHPEKPSHAHQVRGGEPKKPPRAPEDTTPEPGPGPHEMKGHAPREPAELPPDAPYRLPEK